LIECLLVIDFPDERYGSRRQFDHMHAWGSKVEMNTLKRLLEDRLGNNNRHQIVDGRICPFCGQSSPPFKEDT